MIQKFRFQGVILTASVTAGSYIYYNQKHMDGEIKKNREIEGHKLFEVTERLKIAFPANSDNNQLKQKGKSIDGITFYYLKSPKFGSNGLPNCRIGRTEINAPLDEIETIWLNQGIRKEWDRSSNCENSQVIIDKITNRIYYYVIGRPGYLYPRRDYGFSMTTLPGGAVGLNDYRAKVFVSVDASNEVPKSFWAVRGKINSLLILEPKSAERTLVTYIIETDYSGWLFSYLANLFADGLIDTLKMLKNEMEKETEDDSKLTVEQAALSRFKRHKEMTDKKNQGISIIEDISTSSEDLKETIKILENRLKDIRNTEISQNIDLSELKTRVTKDITKAKARLLRGGSDDNASS